MRVTQTENKGLIKHWTEGVDFADNALDQCSRIAEMPFIHKHIAVMPDVHLGKGATVGSVIATKKAIIPAAVGVDIGCGMQAVRTTLRAEDLPDSLAEMRMDIEDAVPHGRGRWQVATGEAEEAWEGLWEQYVDMRLDHPALNGRIHPTLQLGTLGGGNHFVEICLDKEDQVWVMLHSGSRGVGNRIGSYFIEKAREDMRRFFINLPDEDLAYIPEGSELFEGYVKAVGWAQRYAAINRNLMMEATLKVLDRHCGRLVGTMPFEPLVHVIDCHHNYISKENHFGENVWVTRKGAVRARVGDMGIIPGSMGARSFIVEGLGNKDSFCSCSHGAGRVMSRTQAKKLVSMAEHLTALHGIECRKDEGVLDETPKAYKDIEAVMAAQSDLVEIKHELKQVLCVKG